MDFVNVDPELFIYQYQNIDDEFNASGVEVELTKSFGDKLNFAMNYTFTKAEARFSSRIPKHKWNASLGYKVSAKSFVGLAYRFNSKREDSFFDPITFESQTINLNSYGLLDLSASHQITKNLKLFAGMSNILDEEYEVLYRFQAQGRNVRAGFVMSF